MTNEMIKDAYFRWLCSFVRGSSGDFYTKLLHKLHRMRFEYIIPMDENRMMDGLSLRQKFSNDNSVPYDAVRSALDLGGCSILEMMVALAIRCENSAMYDPEYGDRTSVWFWTMIVSLGLYPMYDEKYDEELVHDILLRFLNRDYAPNGAGGLFTVDQANIDLRTVEIWYQMNLYIRTL